MSTAFAFAVTRVINPCAVVTVDGLNFLTDPYFRQHRGLPMSERIGVRADELPPISAVLGGHGSFDHWQLAPLRGLLPPELPVLVAHRGMLRRAVRAGFPNTRVVADGQEVGISSGVTVTAVRGDRVFGRWTNHYVISGRSGTVYIGTEAGSLDPMRRLPRTWRIDVAILPIDGLSFVGRQLVMDARAAVEATEELGARILAPIHFSQRSVPPLIRCRSGLDELHGIADGRVEIRHAPTGTRVSLVQHRGL